MKIIQDFIEKLKDSKQFRRGKCMFMKIAYFSFLPFWVKSPEKEVVPFRFELFRNSRSGTEQFWCRNIGGISEL